MRLRICVVQMKWTYSTLFDGDTLLVLAFEGVSEETNSKVQGRSQHTIPEDSEMIIRIHVKYVQSWSCIL